MEYFENARTLPLPPTWHTATILRVRDLFADVCFVVVYIYRWVSVFSITCAHHPILLACLHPSRFRTMEHGSEEDEKNKIKIKQNAIGLRVPIDENTNDAAFEEYLFSNCIFFFFSTRNNLASKWFFNFSFQCMRKIQLFIFFVQV